MPSNEEPATLQHFWDMPLQDLLTQLGTSPQGLTSEEAARRLRQYGPNTLRPESRFAGLLQFLRMFANPLVLILLFASGLSLATGARIEASIIIVIVLVSVLLNYYQEYQARHAVEKLRQSVASTAEVLRDGTAQELPVTALAPGDIIKLNAGDLVPADARLLEATDLNVRESALTGESMPAGKESVDLTGSTHSLTDATNCVFLGTSVQTGFATALVVQTGAHTAFGDIAVRLAARAPETEFDRGIRKFGLLITRLILLLVVFVFLVNAAKYVLFPSVNYTTSFLLDSFLFAVALAVGLTPELLPVITSVTLAQGARRMAAKKVIVKQLASIENFGSMEILCSDKTGTLTEGEIVLDKHVDVQGSETERVLQLIYLNSYFEAGIKSPLDDAILKHEHPAIQSYAKIDEIPFDFSRKRLSVVVQQGDERTLITKGAAENVFAVCTTVDIGGAAQPFDTAQQQAASATYQQLSSEGYRVLGVAIRTLPAQQSYGVGDEHDMMLVGFAAFLDPPKPGVGDTLTKLKEAGVSIVILTGDNKYVTLKVAHDVGLDVSRIFTAEEIDAMADAALAQQALQGAIFAHVSPEQKNRVITALKAHGHVVGFLGDGINDAPSLHAADIGISVVNGVDVAKSAASIILLEKNLDVLHDGVIEGRRSFANIMKYITMGTSSNFGNMFSMAGASIFLPFLPMLPTQILLNNLLYDFSQLSIPTDNVDPQLLMTPKRWNIDFIRQFMLIIGPLSSIYDFLTFGILLYFFKADQTLFHTGWFVESIATQTLVIFVIRTATNPLRSRPSNSLIGAMFGIVALAILIPYTYLGRLLGFTAIPPLLLGVIALLSITYLALVQAVKAWFYRKHALM